MAAVRRILDSTSSKPRHKKRVNAINCLLGNPPLQNVTLVSVRNAWEHFDERLDDELGKCIPGDRSVAEIHVSCKPPSLTTTVLRRFDPVKFAIHYLDLVVSLENCAIEMDDLKMRIDQAYVTLKTERVDI